MKRKAHILTPGRASERPRYIVYMDSESRVRTDGRHIPYLVVANFKNYQDGRQKTRVYPKREHYNFWKDAATYGDKKRTIYIFGHNLGYDVLVTGAIPSLVALGYKITSWFEKGSTYLMYFHNPEMSRKLVLLSSTNYFAQSLEKLGEVLGVPKLSIEYNKADLNTAIQYCKRDVEILQKAVETFIDFIDTENLGNFGKTVPGQAFNSYKHRFMDHEIFIHTNEKAIELERRAYYGGRTECFFLGEMPLDRYYYYLDFNSMYPYVMKEFTFPVKLLTYRKRMGLDELTRHIAEGTGVVAKVLVSTNESVYPVRVNDNLIFPVGTFSTYLCTPELEYGLERGHIKQIQAAALYEMKPIFIRYVDYFYTARLAAKAAGDKVRDLLYKLFMNSLYGKFGQKSDEWERVGDADPELVQEIKVVNAETKEATVHKIFGGSEFKKIAEEESYNSFPAIAAHVTAYARLTLAKYFTLAGWDNVYYCDTDSLFTCQQGYDRLAGTLDLGRLGALKLEKSSDLVKILCPKDYQFGTDIKHKGIRKDAKQITNDTWQTTTWPKLASFIKTGKLTGYRNIKRIKTLRRVYTKGWVLPGGKVVPLVLEYRKGDNYILPGPPGTLTDPGEMKKKYKGWYTNGAT